MTNEQIVKAMMPHLKAVVDLAEKQAHNPNADRPKQIWVLIRNNIAPLYNQLSAPGRDITQTDFFTAIEGKWKYW